MLPVLVFGSIFTYLDKQYVYLASGTGITYAALILHPRMSQQVKAMREGSIQRRGEKLTREFSAFCFVELTTPDYVDHIAHLHQTDQHKEPGRFLVGENDKLNKDDVLSLYKEIMEGPVPLKLKQLISDLDIE